MDVVSATPPAAATEGVAAPVTVTAAEAAIGKAPADYRAARRAERAGKPLPAVTVTPDPPKADAGATPPAEPPAPQLTRREREQQEANERTRKAVEAATADLRAENERLKASTAPPRTEPVAAPPVVTAPPPAEKFPALDQWAEKNPGKTFDDYLDARDEFRTTQAEQTRQMEAALSQRAADLTKRGQAFGNAMGEALKAEPDLAEKIPPAMRDPRTSVPLSAMNPEQLKTATFSNLVAEAAFRSANGGSGKPGELLKYLHAHQDETIRIAGIAQQYGVMEGLMALERIDERLAVQHRAPAPAPVAPTPKVRKITAAPPAQETLGSRPAESVDPMTAAIASGDTRSYRQQRREERAAKLGFRR